MFSPFRYPGGKTWFLPGLRAWLSSLPRRPAFFVEPFAGGGSASLAVAAEGLADRVVMVEKDPEVAAVWRTVMGGAVEELVERALGFEPKAENIAATLTAPSAGDMDAAFRVLLRNRISRHRYLHPAAPLRLRHDKTGAVFWRPRTLAERLRAAARLAPRIEFIEGDALAVLPAYAGREDCALFLDPPYSVGLEKTHRLYYRHAELDHERLFALMKEARSPFLMWYDDAPAIRALAEAHGFRCTPAPVRKGGSVGELVITPATREADMGEPAWNARR